MRGLIIMTVEEAIEIWQKTKSPYLKRDMEKFIRKERRKTAKNENQNMDKEGKHMGRA